MIKTKPNFEGTLAVIPCISPFIFTTWGVPNILSRCSTKYNRDSCDGFVTTQGMFLSSENSRSNYKTVATAGIRRTMYMDQRSVDGWLQRLLWPNSPV